MSVWVTIAIASVGVGGWLGGCVWVRVEKGIAERAGFLVGCMFDYIIASEVAETGGPFVFVCLLHWKIVEGFSGSDCLISFEWRVYVVQRCVSLGDDGNGVSGWWGSLGGCVWVRVEERMADRAWLLVGCMFDLGLSGCDCLISFEYRVNVVQHVFSWDVFHYIFASSLFLKW